MLYFNGAELITNLSFGQILQILQTPSDQVTELQAVDTQHTNVELHRGDKNIYYIIFMTLIATLYYQTWSFLVELCNFTSELVVIIDQLCHLTKTAIFAL